jgi:hypothetical protein
MSRSIPELALRILVAGGLLGAGLIVPARAAAQTIGPERAFLNYAIATPQAAGPRSFWASVPGSTRIETDAGARALLGRTAADETPAPYIKPAGIVSDADVTPATGDRALLGSSTKR